MVWGVGGCFDGLVAERGSTISRLLAQNERLISQNELLIGALVANQPVEVIRALNPVPVVGADGGWRVPWGDDQVRREGEADPWGDDGLSNEELLARSGGRAGWVDPPGGGEPVDAEVVEGSAGSGD